MSIFTDTTINAWNPSAIACTIYLMLVYRAMNIYYIHIHIHECIINMHSFVRYSIDACVYASLSGVIQINCVNLSVYSPSSVQSSSVLSLPLSVSTRYDSYTWSWWWWWLWWSWWWWRWWWSWWSWWWC